MEVVVQNADVVDSARIKASTEKAFPFRRRLKSMLWWRLGGSLARRGLTLAIRGSCVREVSSSALVAVFRMRFPSRSKTVGGA